MRVEDVKGKGNVVRRAFGDLEADVYLLIDGDDTYDAAASTSMIQTLLDGPYDHVLGVAEPGSTLVGLPARTRRAATASSTASSAGHSARTSATCSVATGSSPAAS